MYLGAKRRYTNTLPFLFLSFPNTVASPSYQYFRLDAEELVGAGRLFGHVERLGHVGVVSVRMRTLHLHDFTVHAADQHTVALLPHRRRHAQPHSETTMVTFQEISSFGWYNDTVKNSSITTLL